MKPHVLELEQRVVDDIACEYSGKLRWVNDYYPQGVWLELRRDGCWGVGLLERDLRGIISAVRLKDYVGGYWRSISLKRVEKALKEKFLYIEPEPDRCVLEPRRVASKFILHISEKESLSKIKVKRTAYTARVRKHNRNWVEIFAKPRGKYRYKVFADCVQGFTENKYEFTLNATSKIHDFLRLVPHKTDMSIMPNLNTRTIAYADFETFEQAETFAHLLAGLEVADRFQEVA